MNDSLFKAVAENFLGHSPNWYKLTIVGFLVVNPLLFFWVGSFVAGWVLVAQFIFTLAMALKCYPLQPGGLLAIQAVIIGMTTPEAVYYEAEHNLPVIMLLMFMVAGIFFLKEMLLFTFTKILLGVRSKVLLSLLFCSVAAVLSAFLDALTVTAVVITVAEGFYAVYHKVASGKGYDIAHDSSDDGQVETLYREDLEQFRAFLRNLMMHAAVGTALGGVMTLVGEPQNLLIAKEAGWEFLEFFLKMAPVTIPVFVVGLLTCLLLEILRLVRLRGRPAPRRAQHSRGIRPLRERAAHGAREGGADSPGGGGDYPGCCAGESPGRGGNYRPDDYRVGHRIYRCCGGKAHRPRV